MKILWICFVWPEPCSSAAGLRTRQLIDTCRTLSGPEGELRICSPCQPNKHQAELEALGIKTACLAPNHSKFDDFIAEFRPDLVCFDRFMIEEQFSWRVREIAPNAVRLLDTIDLHSLRRTRQKKVALGETLSALSDSERNSDDALREVAAIFRSDIALVVSDVELELLLTRYNVPAELLHLCRPFYQRHPIIPDFSARRNFVTIGNFNHAPNLDSVYLLKSEIWPRILARLNTRGVNDCELHIYGAYPDRDVYALDDLAAGFRVFGYSEDAAATLAMYRLNLAPLRFGAGIKGKICDGWSVGTPCITTSIGAEGMHANLPFGGAIEDDPERLAEGAVDMFLDPSRWKQAQRHGFEILEAIFDRAGNVASFISAIERVSMNLSSQRERNFIGAMLWFHANRSTEYLSRWIEAKNSKLNRAANI